MKIEGYQAQTPSVTAINGDWLSAFVVDDIPKIGEVIEIIGPQGERLNAVVRRLSGARRVDAMLLRRPDWLRPGLKIRRSGEDAYISGPAPGKTRLAALDILAGDEAPGASIPFRQRSPRFAEMLGARPPIRTGVGPLDTLAAPAKNGFNLALDTSPKPAAFDKICRLIAEKSKFDALLWLSGDGRGAAWASSELVIEPEDPRHISGLRVLASWAAHLRDQGQHVLVCADLPALAYRGLNDTVEAAMGVSIGEVIDLLGTTLSSTHQASITALMRLPLFKSAMGIDAIIETMGIGEVDAQIFIDEEGRFEPARSRTSADLDEDTRHAQRRALSLLGRAAAARDKLALMGEFGVEPDELRAIEAVEAMRVEL